MTTLQELISRHEFSNDVPGFDQPCEGSKYHSPTPLITFPLDLADPDLRTSDDPKDLVRLCSVCSDNLGVFLMLVADDPPWEVRRQFGNRIRALGNRVIAHRGRA